MKRARGRGEGSYSRLADGRWVYQISAGVGPDGKRQRPRFYGDTKEEARDRGEEYRRKLRRGDPVLVDRTRLGDYLTSWLDGLIRPPNTIRVYEVHIRLHLIPRLGHVKLGALRTDDVRQWQRAMLDSGQSAYTTNYARKVLVNALNDAVQDEYIARNVASLVKDVRYVTKRRTPFTPEQAIAFVRHVRAERLGPLYITAIGTALRSGEVRGLLWSDIEGDVMHVTRQLTRLPDGHQLRDLKSGESGQRSLPLPGFVQQALELQRDAQRFDERAAGKRWDTTWDGLVFRTQYGRPVSEQSLRADFAEQLAAADLPSIRVHDLRHSCATLLLSLGVEMRVVQAILGHSAMKTTEIYAHVLPSLTADAMGRLDGLLGEQAQ